MAPHSTFVFITSFYSGRTYRIDVGPALSSSSSSNSSNNNFTLTFGAILGLLRAHWKNANYKTADTSSSSTSTNQNHQQDENNNNASTTTRSSNPASHQAPPPTMDLLLADATSSAATSFVAATDEIPRNLLFFDSPHQNLITSSNHNNRLLFLLYKPAHRDNMERLLMERTTLHPQDLSPSPANQVEKGTTALLSIFTHLSAKARQEVEGLLAKIDSARQIMDGYEENLESIINKVKLLRDGEVAAEISVTSKESLAEFVADVRSNLSRATSVVSDFQFPSTIHNLLLSSSTTSESGVVNNNNSSFGNNNNNSGAAAATTAGGVGGGGGNSSGSGSSAKLSPDKCYEASATARKELNDMTRQLAHANELVTAVFEQYFPRFESLRALPEAYPVAEDIARRRVDLYQACTRIQNQLSGEAISIQEGIAGFVQQYGSRFPQNVLRGIDAPVPALHVAYEPLIKTVPMSVDGGTSLLKKFGLLCSHTGANTNNEVSSSTPGTTQPPSPNTAITATFSSSSPPNNNNNNTSNTSRQQSAVLKEEEVTEQQQRNTTRTAAMSTGSDEGIKPSTRVVEASSPSSSLTIEKILELVQLSEMETEARRELESDASEERLDVTALRANEEKMIFVTTNNNNNSSAVLLSSQNKDPNNNNNTTTSQISFHLPGSAGVTSSNLSSTASSTPPPPSNKNLGATASPTTSNENNNNNQKSSSNFLSLGNFFKQAGTENTNNQQQQQNNTNQTPITPQLYSQAVSFDISRCLTLWNLGEAMFQQQVKSELTLLLSSAVLDFQRPIADRPAFSIVLGGMFKVVWAGGDASPEPSAGGGASSAANLSSASSSSLKTKGRITAVHNMKMLNEEESNDDDFDRGDEQEDDDENKNANDDDDDENKNNTSTRKRRGRGNNSNRSKKNSRSNSKNKNNNSKKKNVNQQKTITLKSGDGMSLMNELVALMPFAELVCEVRRV